MKPGIQSLQCLAALSLALAAHAPALATPPSEKHSGTSRKGAKSDLTPILRRVSEDLKQLRDRFDLDGLRFPPSQDAARSRYGAGSVQPPKNDGAALSPFVPPEKIEKSPAPPAPASPPRPVPTSYPKPLSSPVEAARSDPAPPPAPVLPPVTKSDPAPAPGPKLREQAIEEKPSGPRKRSATIETSDLDGFEAYPEQAKSLVTAALELTKKDLAYQYGSHDPVSGGMDCSGFIYWLLKSQGIAGVPRSSHEQYLWVRKRGSFFAVLSRGGSDVELEELKPGDLLFWTGTYKIERDIPVTHVMVYLGKLKRSGRRVMAGASEGRTFGGEQMFGVSVFDFRLGKRGGETGFIGYGRVDG